MIKLGQAVYLGKPCIVHSNDETGMVTLSRSARAKSTLDLLNCYQGSGLLDKWKLYQEEAEVVLEVAEDALDQLDFAWLPCITPPEVWAVGVTYKRQAREHDDDVHRTTSKTEELYRFVYENERAEVFFKGFARSVRGHKDALMLRADSQLVLPEAETVLVLGDEGKIMAVTCGNDLTAWDIEKECPLYLNQAKIWDGSAGVGPYLIPYEAVKDPYDLQLRCQVVRNGEVLIDSTGSTRGLKRSYEELIHYLNYNNVVPMGTLLFTGTACIVPHDVSLESGDTVIVEQEGFGALVNPVLRHDPVVFEKPHF